ncbi:ammonium transporter [Maribacter sp. 6B07]|uniref:Ammonium transporter n=3 Tax=Maribacter TaxID=252356 RepID=A0A1H4P7W5_9FLAO|nr:MULTISPECIES: ammonium transporter [Maribacter]HAF77530.1 ammonium transporter [Maribacter sp.]MBU2899759.1 ammonium transporter [Maribacter dokdonensis]MDP2527039.1 ammonium transporter [Maribacter dokdonensis]PHN93994.1 ammonium transporter [Maribacter sp. 6B07]SDS90443.1 ammonium transporter, Amt family [Maribacter dokdonensis]|tara:strand:+ start:124677 stop:125915 length:1239 start_codon:yes stop_codon:yes gene_type:complete
MDAGLFTANNVWMMLATALVFFMHTGFAFLEIGLTRQKNTINILFKNIFIITGGLLLYYAWGFNLMYPGFEDGDMGLLKFAGFGIGAPEGGMTPDYADGGYTWWTDFLFQGMFAATAATIVSGAVAERMKIGAFMIFTVIYVGLVYPIVGAWKWGGGFLDSWGFYDFAGSTLVHSVGGWAALVAIYLLGSRIGKFGKDGKPNAIPGHSIPMATAGVLILWLGWFGFNGGSVLSADPELTSLVLVTTSLAAAAGGFGAMITSTILYKNLDLTMFLNGILGGLVGITAGADLMSPNEAVIIGFIAGIIIVGGVALVDKLKLDDPVGAVAVHLICGIWGTLVVGIFGSMASGAQFMTQLYGVLIVGGFCIVTSGIILGVLKATIGLRVSKEEEVEGLDLHEHGMDAYADFRMNQH